MYYISCPKQENAHPASPFSFDIAHIAHHFVIMIPIRTHIATIYRYLQHPPGKYLVFALAALGVLACIGIGAAWQDYQTNWFSRRLGRFLDNTNRLRPQEGTIWQQIQAQTRTRETIDPNDVPLNDIQSGLPDPVNRNRFQLNRIPDTGMPGYVGLWKTPLPNINVSDRNLNDIATSLRIYKQGLALIETLELLDIQFHPQVQAQVEQLYAQMGDINTLATPDTLLDSEGDTLIVIAPDSTKAVVFEELAANIIPDLKQKEKAALVRDYKNNRIAQLVLHRGLGHYEGELYRENNTTPLPFEIETNAVLRILNIPTNTTP